MIVQRGLAAGLLFGGLLALSSYSISVLFLKWALQASLLPSDPETMILVAGTVLSGGMLGGFWSLFLGRWMEKNPRWHIHLLPLAYLPGMWVGNLPALRLLMVGLAHGGAALIWPYLLGHVSPKQWKYLSLFAILLTAAGTLSPLSSVSVSPSSASSQPNLLWVVFDTTRADHLSAYGYKRETAPNFSALVQQGTLFEHAYAPASWTLPSHASMLTGRYPHSHGCHDEHAYLEENVPTLPALLKAVGYRTGLFSSNPWLGRSSGLNRGFDVELPAWGFPNLVGMFPAAAPLRPFMAAADKGARVAAQGAVRFLQQGGPFFVMVNEMEAHVPYDEQADPGFFLNPAETPAALQASQQYMKKLYRFPDAPAPDAAEREALLNLYDAGIHANDQQLGVLIEALKEQGEFDNTLIVIVADHGEAFGEEGMWEHHLSLVEPVIHVPLLLVWPGHFTGGTRVTANVSLVDLLPTVLEGFGLPVPVGVQGHSLFHPEDRFLFAETFTPAGAMVARRLAALGRDPANDHLSLVIQGRRQLLRQNGTEQLREETGNTVSDPAMQADLSAKLDDFLADRVATPTSPVPEMGDATQKHLENLGYLEKTP